MAARQIFGEAALDRSQLEKGTVIDTESRQKMLIEAAEVRLADGQCERSGSSPLEYAALKPVDVDLEGLMVEIMGRSAGTRRQHLICITHKAREKTRK